MHQVTLCRDLSSTCAIGGHNFQERVYIFFIVKKIRIIRVIRDELVGLLHLQMRIPVLVHPSDYHIDGLHLVASSKAQAEVAQSPHLDLEGYVVRIWCPRQSEVVVQVEDVLPFRGEDGTRDYQSGEEPEKCGQGSGHFYF